MEFASPEFWAAVAAIIMIDLVLAGDNAIVIGLAARNLPADLQKKAVFWGAIGAVFVRVLLTTLVVWLLKIPGFLVAGGLALLWIAHGLVADEGGGESEENIVPAVGFRQAIQTIIVADTIMGVDNVLAVAGAAHGSLMLVIFGLIVSIPIVMLGSTLILKAVERWPIIITLGAAVLGWTAAKMVTSEAFLKDFFNEHHGWRFALYGFCILVSVAPTILRQLRGKVSATTLSLVFTIAWLVVFNYLEDYVDARFYPLDDPVSLPHELIDLVMWLGWIPFVLMISKALGKDTPASGKALNGGHS